MLFSLGATEEARVLDLYAGCGALGLEALSRGAEHCTFIEADRRAIRCIGNNIDALGYDDRTTVVQGDVLDWLDSTDAEFDLVVADPPYRAEDWDALFERIDAKWLVAESGADIPEHDGWDVVREKRYGTTVVTVFTRREPRQ